MTLFLKGFLQKIRSSAFQGLADLSFGRPLGPRILLKPKLKVGGNPRLLESPFSFYPCHFWHVWGSHMEFFVRRLRRLAVIFSSAPAAPFIVKTKHSGKVPMRAQGRLDSKSLADLKPPRPNRTLKFDLQELRSARFQGLADLSLENLSSEIQALLTL